MVESLIKETKALEDEYRQMKRDLKRQRQTVATLATGAPPPPDAPAMSKDDLKGSSYARSSSLPTDPYARINASSKLNIKKKKSKVEEEDSVPDELKRPKSGRSKLKDESEILNKLNKFTKHIREERIKKSSQPSDTTTTTTTNNNNNTDTTNNKDKDNISTNMDNNNDDNEDKDWMANKFECPWEKRRRLQEAALEEQKALEDYVSIDSRTQGKASDTRSRHQRGLDRSKKTDRF